MRTELDSLVATAQASIRVTERILVALDDYPQGEAEAKWEPVLRGDTQLTVDYEAGTMTLHVAGKPLFTCPTADHYGPNYPEVLASLAEDAVSARDRDLLPAERWRGTAGGWGTHREHGRSGDRSHLSTRIAAFPNLNFVGSHD